jgi:hypothetical protein
LCAEADSFFADLVQRSNRDDKAAGKRVIIQKVKETFFTEEAGKKVVNDLLPLWIQAQKTG